MSVEGSERGRVGQNEGVSGKMMSFVEVCLFCLVMRTVYLISLLCKMMKIVQLWMAGLV